VLLLVMMCILLTFWGRKEDDERDMQKEPGEKVV
jgi:hypothetical protein